MKRYFHDELEQLRSSLILIGEKAAHAGRMAIDGYLENDLEKTEAAIALDDEIDALEVEIDRACVRYITLRSPVSTDVRLIFVAIKASHDLERAGDEAHNIAKRTRNILLRDSKTLCSDSIAEMSQIAFSMMQDAITCFLDEDCEMAKRIIARDEEVDKINKENFLRLASKDASQHQDNSTQIETIFISKSIERIADHAKNLAEEVIYLLEGDQENI
jgi:phosphate transport system protein